DIVEILKATLKSRGYEVSAAADGEEGLRLVRSARPDLLILDLKMPRVSGLEVARRLREDPDTRDIPILILSAIGEKTGKKSEEFWRAGLGTDDFVSKPFDPIALLGRVEYLLRRKEYVSSHPEPTVKEEGAARVPRPAMRDFTPREIIRCFLESWNGQKFADEWACLSEPMRGSLERDDYVGRRRQAYAEEGANPHRQRMVSVVEEQTTGDSARVLVEREDLHSSRASRRREQYTLARTDDGWKITGVRVVHK
ncbi:response regulator, partial [Candidatus Sumerlaeota bacterium]|nr:response regulator [Candidatus Sumerlaeota bacterium]